MEGREGAGGPPFSLLARPPRLPEPQATKLLVGEEAARCVFLSREALGEVEGRECFAIFLSPLTCGQGEPAATPAIFRPSLESAEEALRLGADIFLSRAAGEGADLSITWPACRLIRLEPEMASGRLRRPPKSRPWSPASHQEPSQHILPLPDSLPSLHPKDGDLFPGELETKKKAGVDAASENQVILVSGQQLDWTAGNSGARPRWPAVTAMLG